MPVNCSGEYIDEFLVLGIMGKCQYLVVKFNHFNCLVWFLMMWTW